MSHSRFRVAEAEVLLPAVNVGVLATERDGRAPLAAPLRYGRQRGGHIQKWMNCTKNGLVHASRYLLHALSTRLNVTWVEGEAA